jgi:hypothetical protein
LQMSPADPRLRPRELLACLVRHDIDFVLIGALAATLHGSPLRTNDADICPKRTPRNLQRLAQALIELQARIYSVEDPRGVTFKADDKLLGVADIWNLVTRYGRLDISFSPSGTRGYDDLVRSARDIDIGDGTTVKVASLLDIIRSKEAANRDKDRAVIPLLREMLDRFGEHP